MKIRFTAPVINNATSLATLVGAPRGSSRHSSIRGRVIAVCVAAMSILLATMTPSFLGNTGTTSATVTAVSGSLVYQIASGSTIPTAVTSLEYTPSTAISGGTISTATLPGWSPAANSAGSVTTAGDVTLIDATQANNGVEANLYVTNMANLQTDYSSWVLPVTVYQSACTTSCTWSPYITGNYVTSTTGNLNFNLPKGFYYDIVVPTGGSYYCISTTNTANLAPQFYVTGQSY